MKGANVRLQTNIYRSKTKKRPTKYVVKVCVACTKFRNRCKVTGSPVTDMRVGAR